MKALLATIRAARSSRRSRQTRHAFEYLYPTASNAAVDGAEDGTWRSERVAVEVAHPRCGMTRMSFALSTETVPDSPEPPTCHSPALLVS